MPDMVHHVLETARQTCAHLLLTEGQQKQLREMVTGLQRVHHPIVTLLHRRVGDELRRSFYAERPEDVIRKTHTGLDVVVTPLHQACTYAVR
jgi:hypothetical protein